MHFFSRHRENIRQSSMSSRLLWPCLLLAALLLTFGAALFLFASLHNTKKDTTRSLEIQYSVFQNDMERYFDQLAVMGVNLSEDMGALVDQQLASRKMTFEQLNDSPEVLNTLEEEMIDPLSRSLRRTSCSGAFVLLDDPQQHPAVPGLYADGAVQPPRHLGGCTAVFAAPAGPRRHHVRAVRL